VTYSLDSNNLLSTFNISSLEEIDSAIESIAPSICEYHFDNLITYYGDTNGFLNRSQIQKTIHLGDYSLYLDYSENIFIEKRENLDEYATESLW
jgi:hypothetical protein